MKKLGDAVADLIETVAPEFAESRKDCTSCKNKRERLNRFHNNVNAIFSNK